MKDKIIKGINLILENLPKIKGNKYTTLVIYGFLIVVLTLFLIFLGGWGYNVYQSKTADLNILVQVLEVFCNPGFTALLLVILKLGVDKDNDGIADILEEEQK